MNATHKVLTIEDIDKLNLEKKDVYEMVVKKMKDKISLYNQMIEKEELELIVKDKDVCKVEFVINNSKRTSVDNVKSILGILDSTLEYKELTPVIVKRDFKQDLAGYFKIFENKDV